MKSVDKAFLLSFKNDKRVHCLVGPVILSMHFF